MVWSGRWSGRRPDRTKIADPVVHCSARTILATRDFTRSRNCPPGDHSHHGLQAAEGLPHVEVRRYGLGSHYSHHDHGLFPADASGVPWSTACIGVTRDPIADLSQGLAAEQKARATYEYPIVLAHNPCLKDGLKFLRVRGCRPLPEARRDPDAGQALLGAEETVLSPYHTNNIGIQPLPVTKRAGISVFLKDIPFYWGRPLLADPGHSKIWPRKTCPPS